MFEPSWTLQIGGRQVNGTGILGKQRPSDDLIDLFIVTMNGTELIVLPKEGKIMHNLATIFNGAPGNLIYGRTMKLIMGGRWIERHCQKYFIGIQNGERHVFNLFEDGRVEAG